MQLSEYIVMTEPLLGAKDLAEIRETLGKLEWKKATTFHALEDYRTCSVFALSEAVARIAGSKELQRRLVMMDAMLFQAVRVARERYQELYPRFQSDNDVGYDLLRYERGQFYKEHTDRSAQFPRLLSVSVGLNDDYEGGEFAFFERELEVRLGAGCAVLFPSNFMYPHAIREVTAGTRYSMVTWFV